MKPPKFTTYDKIDVTKVEIAAEVMADKMRWELRSIEERDGQQWSEDIELKSVEKKTVHNSANATIEFCKQRATDLPSCRRITVPAPGDTTTETTFANMKNRIVNATKMYIDKKCDEKGNIVNETFHFSHSF